MEKDNGIIGLSIAERIKAMQLDVHLNDDEKATLQVRTNPKFTGKKVTRTAFSSSDSKMERNIKQWKEPSYKRPNKSPTLKHDIEKNDSTMESSSHESNIEQSRNKATGKLSKNNPFLAYDSKLRKSNNSVGQKSEKSSLKSKSSNDSSLHMKLELKKKVVNTQSGGNGSYMSNIPLVAPQESSSASENKKVFNFDEFADDGDIPMKPSGNTRIFSQLKVENQEGGSSGGSQYSYTRQSFRTNTPSPTPPPEIIRSSGLDTRQSPSPTIRVNTTTERQSKTAHSEESPSSFSSRAQRLIKRRQKQRNAIRQQPLDSPTDPNFSERSTPVRRNTAHAPLSPNNPSPTSPNSSHQKDTNYNDWKMSPNNDTTSLSNKASNMLRQKRSNSHDRAIPIVPKVQSQSHIERKELIVPAQNLSRQSIYENESDSPFSKKRYEEFVRGLDDSMISFPNKEQSTLFDTSEDLSLNSESTKKMSNVFIPEKQDSIRSLSTTSSIEFIHAENDDRFFKEAAVNRQNQPETLPADYGAQILTSLSDRFLDASSYAKTVLDDVRSDTSFGRGSTLSLPSNIFGINGNTLVSKQRKKRTDQVECESTAIEVEYIEQNYH